MGQELAKDFKVWLVKPDVDGKGHNSSTAVEFDYIVMPQDIDIPYVLFVFTDLDIDTLVDGVYKFRLLILDSGDEQLGIKVKYFVQDYSIQECLKTEIETIIDSCDCECEDWCDLNKADTILHSAKYQASIGNFTVSQKMIEYLTSECEVC